MGLDIAAEGRVDRGAEQLREVDDRGQTDLVVGGDPAEQLALKQQFRGRPVAFLISPAFSSSSSTATPLSVLVLPVPGQKAGKGCELILGELLAVKRLREHAHARLSRASA